MTIGPGDDVLWADNVRLCLPKPELTSGAQQPRSAAAYIDSVCAWIEMVLNDKTVVRERASLSVKTRACIGSFGSWHARLITTQFGACGRCTGACTSMRSAVRQSRR